MDKTKPRGVKKGESPNWNVGRKSKDKDKKNINKSITLPQNIWDVLDNKAKEKGFKSGNALAGEIIKKFYDLF